MEKQVWKQRALRKQGAPCVVRKVGYFGLVSPLGQGDRVPKHRTASDSYSTQIMGKTNYVPH